MKKLVIGTSASLSGQLVIRTFTRCAPRRKIGASYERSSYSCPAITGKQSHSCMETASFYKKAEQSMKDCFVPRNDDHTRSVTARNSTECREPKGIN